MRVLELESQMTREIRFRAWDKSQNRMLCPIWITDGAIHWPMGASILVHEYIPEQFTGLRDKNGREIFEGDIIKMGLGEIFWDQEEAGFHVRWHDKKFRDARASVIQRYDGHEPVFANSHVSFEVIGNIHENPELLK